jgi:hypothetical protein
LPCIRALGDLRAAEATGELAQVFSAASNSVEVRVAAMTAIGKALAAAEASRAVMTAVLAGMQEQNLDLRRASWYAFANSGAEPALHFEKAILALPPAAPEAPAAPGEAPGEAPKAAKPPAEPGAEPAEPDAEAPTPEETPAEEPEAEAGAEGTETEGAGTEGAGTEAEEGTSGR